MYTHMYIQKLKLIIQAKIFFCFFCSVLGFFLFFLILIRFCN